MVYNKAQFDQQPSDIDFEDDDFDDDFNDDFEEAEDELAGEEDDDAEIQRILQKALHQPPCDA